jgi:stress-induced morphogen
MAVSVPRGKSDSVIKKIAKQLERYQADHPDAEIEVYRKNSVSIRVRVIDPAFRTLSRSQRARMVWPLLRELPEEALGEVSMVLLISPDEKENSLVSQEFDDPLPSQL